MELHDSTKSVKLFLRRSLRLYYRKNMATASSVSADTSPAYIEFAQLECWLASSSALQLPLHQIESQQQDKGREVQRLLLQTPLATPRQRRCGASLATPSARR